MKKKTKYYLVKAILMVFGLALIGVGGYLAWSKQIFYLNQYNITQDQKDFTASSFYNVLGLIIMTIAVIMSIVENNLIDIVFYVVKEKRKKYYLRLLFLSVFSVTYIILLFVFIKKIIVLQYGICFVYGIWLFDALMSLIFFIKMKDDYIKESEEYKKSIN
jgi:tellurite resistance protein TehA-like permease